MCTLWILSLLTLGCKDKSETGVDEADADTDTDTDADTDADTDTDTTPDSGSITVSVEASGAEDEILVAFAWSGEPFASSQIASLCEQITADPQTISGPLLVSNSSDPCDTGKTMAFDGGEYTVFAGSFTPGKTVPNLCSEMTLVDVDGDVSVTLPALGVCPK